MAATPLQEALDAKAPKIQYAVCDEDGDEHSSMLLIKQRCDTLEEAVALYELVPHWRGGIHREVDDVIQDQIPAEVIKEIADKQRRKPKYVVYNCDPAYGGQDEEFSNHASLEAAAVTYTSLQHSSKIIYRVDGQPDQVVPEIEIQSILLKRKQRGQPEQRVVVCAACRYVNHANTYLITGARHMDIVMQGQIRTILQANPALEHIHWRWEQGFIDQHGEFMDRKEALQVAIAAGQINTRRPKGSPLDILFSEDLY